ncbi:ribosome hibernation-promoting factor, HPF/YfiA family [Deinococcus peraridilitoris]|uniref:Ribosome hibernation promoting factor n=1 Tax=Deinococcus peraridilitoris (strain DSM 19664 / LMG 22246 / CIP 109416 / KR-200) TaxID=937777 RepID=K9ZW00_DEIPD|nr:ribosome-associated translation inhibitor RaiA [Deinococcus peraridilitoris]AFZ65813.1 ribosomal subunit interface protein [Deinococcus peraridilitoris DSM 19664]
MQIYKLIGRDVDVTDALKDYLDEKLSRLERFSDQITDAKVVLQVRDVRDTMRRNRVEVQLNVPNGLVRAEEHHSDMYAAIDKVSDVLERQLRKVKTKYLKRRHDNNVEDTGGMVAAPLTDIIAASDEDDDAAPEIVRQKRVDLRPMSPEDAVMEMEALHHDFYVFMNASTESCAVVYRRRDGNYGLIEPNA